MLSTSLPKGITIVTIDLLTRSVSRTLCQNITFFYDPSSRTCLKRQGRWGTSWFLSYRSKYTQPGAYKRLVCLMRLATRADSLFVPSNGPLKTELTGVDPARGTVDSPDIPREETTCSRNSAYPSPPGRSFCLVTPRNEAQDSNQKSNRGITTCNSSRYIKVNYHLLSEHMANTFFDRRYHLRLLGP